MRLIEIVRWPLTLVLFLAVALLFNNCDRRATTNGQLERDVRLPQKPDTTQPLVVRFQPGGAIDPPGIGLEPPTVERSRGELRFNLVGKELKQLVGYAFHLRIDPPEGLTLLSHTFHNALAGSGVDLVQRLVNKSGRLIVGAARFRTGAGHTPIGIDIGAHAILLELVFKLPEKPGRWTISFQRNEVRDREGRKTRIDWVGGRLSVR